MTQITEKYVGSVRSCGMKDTNGFEYSEIVEEYGDEDDLRFYPSRVTNHSFANGDFVVFGKSETNYGRMKVFHLEPLENIKNLRSKNGRALIHHYFCGLEEKATDVLSRFDICNTPKAFYHILSAGESYRNSHLFSYWDALLENYLQEHELTNEFREYVLANSSTIITLSPHILLGLVGDLINQEENVLALLEYYLQFSYHYNISKEEIFCGLPFELRYGLFQRCTMHQEWRKRKLLALFTKEEIADHIELLPYAAPNQKEEVVAIYRNRLRALFQDRKIMRFIHFTDVRNLAGILEQGRLMTRFDLQCWNHTVEVTDPDRFDHMINSISLSISFPNYKMLYTKKRDYPDRKWAVLALDVDSLLNRSLQFHTSNAAARSSESCRIDQPKILDFFISLFDPEVGACTRERIKEGGEGRYQRFTTDSQAEVLCLESIPVEDIREVYFTDEDACNQYRDALEALSIKVDCGSGLARYYCDSSGPYQY